ncbi:scm-like with four MBT domains protein 1, partial [Caerostris extrusa]
YNFVKKKKVGRPPLHSHFSSDNGEVIKKSGPGRKKKRKHWSHIHAQAEENEPLSKISKSRDSSETDEGNKFDLKEKESIPRETKIDLNGQKNLKHGTSSNIVTRGAKLPNFGLWHHVSFHNRRGRPRTRPLRPFPPRKVGRPKPPILPKPTLLESNPLDWSVEDVVQYLQKTDIIALAPLIIKEQEIDGQALLMLNLFNVQEYLHLKPEPAEKFCYLIKNLKIEFFTHYVS